MFEDSVAKAATGLAFIIPAIFLIRWFLSRRVGSPDKWVEEHREELNQRYARGEMDEETYRRLLHDLADE